MPYIGKNPVSLQEGSILSIWNEGLPFFQLLPVSTIGLSIKIFKKGG
jgi:hypothetical protein